MRIGGFLPFSLCDYPGTPAAVVFTQGCNYRCPFCHNGELLEAGAGSIDPARVLARLRARCELLPAVVISGGEPTLQEDLPSFCAALKKLGLRVKLDTNGSRPAVLGGLLEAGLLDHVAMDLKAPPDKYSKLAGVPVEMAAIRESMRMLAASGIPHLFRTTVVPSLLSERDLSRIERLVPSGSPYLRQVFRPEQALDPQLRWGSPRRESLDRRVNRVLTG